MDSAALRIIDANANRAREALRVMEDAARFALNDADLCGELKAIRHDLCEALAPLESAGMIAWRDAPGDVGARVHTEAEYEREGVAAVAAAAGKRLTEALRSVEEFAKAVGPEAGGVDAAKAVEALRYRSYEAEKRLTMSLPQARGEFGGWRLCVIVTESRCAHHGWLEVARLAIDGGADCVQLREKQLSDRELLARVRALVDIARPRGAAVVANDRPDIALLARADGVHLGQEDLSPADARRIAGSGLRVGVSTANIADAQRALREGADCCGVGPMFPTATKEKPRIAGPAYLREYLDHVPPLPPALAIGGISPETIGELKAVAKGRRFGVAASSAVCGAEDPAEVCAEMRQSIG